ncbi:MAG: hypothetical protein K2X07_02820 [Caulobacteraceae bacterium]|nr:hypothetical protein [Caulobacteraceae bacterium]
MPAVKPMKPARRRRDPGQKAPAKARLRTLDDLDKRTRAHRDTSELREALAADLGGWDAVSAMKAEVITAAALMGAMIRDRAASYLEGEPVDLASFITLANAQRRHLEALGLERRARDVTPDLRDYLARQAEGGR